MTVVQKTRAATPEISRAFVRRDAFEEGSTLADKGDRPLFEASFGSTTDEEWYRFGLQAGVHLDEQTLHVGEAPKHCPDADAGPLRDLLRRRLESAFADESQQRVHDRLPAALAPTHAAIGRRLGW